MRDCRATDPDAQLGRTKPPSKDAALRGESAGTYRRCSGRPQGPLTSLDVGEQVVGAGKRDASAVRMI